jgi:putative transposase
MKDWQSQAHVRWDCKYHVVILPKYRRKVLYGRMRRGVGQILRDLCRQKDIELVEGKAMPDHIHLLLSVPPRYSIAMTIGYLKGKSATRIHRELLHTKGTLFGRSFWARGYCVSTVGLDEVQIRRYIREQEKLQRDQDQGELNVNGGGKVQRGAGETGNTRYPAYLPADLLSMDCEFTSSGPAGQRRRRLASLRR